MYRYPSILSEAFEKCAFLRGSGSIENVYGSEMHWTYLFYCTFIMLKYLEVSARMAASLARQGPKAAAQLSKQSAAISVAARKLSTSSQQVPAGPVLWIRNFFFGSGSLCSGKKRFFKSIRELFCPYSKIFSNQWGLSRIYAILVTKNWSSSCRIRN